MPPPPINLFKGHPSPALHPASALASAAAAVLHSPVAPVALNYGDDEGFAPLRDAIGTWLADYYHRASAAASNRSPSPSLAIPADRIVITGGASQNLANVLAVFADPAITRHVWLVAPTYYLACRIFDDAGFSGRLRAVPEDNEGIDVVALEKALAAAERVHGTRAATASSYKTPRPWRKIYKHLIYGVPTFSNPSGKVMTVRRRQQLVRLARQYDALIITDDVYDMLRWPTPELEKPAQDTPSANLAVTNSPVPPRIVDIDRVLDGGPADEFGHALSNGSFSKIVAPGCRVGWAEGAPRLVWGVSQAGPSRSGGAPSQLTSTYIHHLLTTGALPAHIDHVLRPAYARRHAVLARAVRTHLLPLGVEMDGLGPPPPPSPPSSSAVIPDHTPVQLTTATTQLAAEGYAGMSGGYFLWLRLPAACRLDGNQLAAYLAEVENVLVAAGDNARVEGVDSDGGGGVGRKGEVREEGQNATTTAAADNANVDAADNPKSRVNEFSRYIRLCFAWEDEARFEDGVARIARGVACHLEVEA